MILLRANTELHQTFERLIEAMKVPVKWNGIFVVIDNYMILQGEVRSLFFHFDTRNVATNIIDIPVKEDEIGEVGTNMRVQNAINLILYAFGKWGTIKGVRVDKSFEQLNTLFTDIMKEMQVEPEYTPSYLRFYRSGMRITYEDVIQTAQEEEQAQPEDEETNEGGLWHKVVWKRAQAEFARADITVSERRKSRIGNNFYLVGYLCPACCGKLHMAVYPAGKEFKIETEEGGVLLRLDESPSLALAINKVSGQAANTGAKDPVSDLLLGGGYPQYRVRQLIAPRLRGVATHAGDPALAAEAQPAGREITERG